jgi:hypothetical protein
MLLRLLFVRPLPEISLSLSKPLIRTTSASASIGPFLKDSDESEAEASKKPSNASA